MNILKKIFGKKEKSSSVYHADGELKLARIHEKDADYGGMLYGAVMELIEVFAKQGHSGASAGRTLALFSKVADYGVLAPLTGQDDEWNEIGNDTFQNNRNSAVFKEGGKAYYIDAITWRTQTGSTWGGSADGIRSRQFIKAFPFTPKKFIVDVIEEEVKKDDWLFHIKDREQLKSVAEYYDIPPIQ